MSGKIGLMRSIGQAVGIVVKAVRTPASGARVVEVDRSSESRRHGEVTLRRTVIDEIVWNDPQPGASSGSQTGRTA